MSDTVNNATIRVDVDATGVEAGLRRVDDASSKTGKNLDSLEASAKKTASSLENVARAPGLETAGDGAGVAAGRMDRATKSMADSIERATAAMSVGKKGSAEYFEALATSRGLNVNALRPFLNQLDEVARKSELAAQAQRKLDDSTKFLEGLRSQTEGFGKTASELAALRAEQLGVSDAAADMIQKMREQEEAGESSFGGLADLAEGAKVAFLAVATAVAAAAVAGAVMISGAIDDLAELDDMAQKTGSSVESLSKIQKLAAVFGTDMGAIDGALSKLSKGMAGVDEDSNKTQKALRALGVSSRDAAGNLRDPSEVLVAAAKSLQGYSDGAAKAALITDLLSKSGPDLLPFLNDLAENYDDVTGTSGAAASAAADFQDQIGWLKLEAQGLVMSIAVAVVPTLRDLAGSFADVFKNQGTLKKGEWSSWADDLGLGFAKASDAVATFARSTSVAWDTLKAVRAGFAVANDIALISPIEAAYESLKGGDGLKEVKKSFGDLKQAISDGLKSIDDLNSLPSDRFEKAYLARLANRKPSEPGTEGGEGGDLDYDTGGSAAKDAKKALEEYEALLDRINGKKVGLDPGFYENLGKLYTGYRAGKQSLAEYVDTVEKYIGQQPFAKQVEEDRLRALKELSDFQDSYSKGLEATSGIYAKRVQDAQTEATRNEELASTYGLTKSAVEQLELAQLEAQLSQRSTIGLTLDQIESLEQLIDAKKRNAGAVARMEGIDAAKKAGEELDRFLDPARAQTFGDALREAFGGAGESISKLTASITGFSQRQAEIEKNRGNAASLYLEGKKTELEYLADVDALNKRSTQNQLSGYGAMAGAAAGFFSEQSKGYQALQTVSQVFHAAELAATLAELVPKGISAVLNQAGGDPYSAFGRMAAMAAIVAGLGVAIGGIGGGGSDTTSVDRQKAIGTGSVLGAPDAKSESIKSALQLIEKHTYQGLSINSTMLTVLRSIDSGINGVSNMLYRADGFTTEVAGMQEGAVSQSFQKGLLGEINKALSGGEWFGKALGKVGNAIFGGNVSTLDTGIKIDPASLAQILAGGISVGQYTDTKKDGGLFSKDKYRTSIADLGAEIDAQFALVFGGMHEAILQSASVLGISGSDFAQKLGSFVLEIDKISTKDLKPEEVQAALQSAISKAGDDMAKFAIDGLTKFQNAGEGALETLTRIATEYQTVDVVMASLGKTFGMVGLGSVEARDRLIDLAGGLEEFASGAEQFLTDFYTDQERANALRTRITPTLDQFGIKTGVEDSLQQFRSVVTGLDLTTEAGARAYATLIQIAPAFKQIADVDAAKFEERAELQNELDELTMSAAQLLAKQRNALDESNRSLFDQIQAVKAKQAADEAAKEAATKAIQAIKDSAASLMTGVDGAFGVLQKVVNRQKQALQDEITVRTQSIAKIEALSQSLRSTLDGMSVQGNEAEDRQAAQAQIQAALAIAKASGKLPNADDLRKSLSVVGQDSSSMFATQTDYLRDFYATRAGIEDLAGLTDNALSVEERSLKSLEDQVKQYDLMLEREQEQIDVLKGISVTGLSIEQALEALRGAVLAAGQNPLNSATSAISDAYKSALGRAPDQAGLDFWKDKAANGLSTGAIVGAITGSPEAQIQKLYKDVLGRTADASGLQFWMKQLSAGLSVGDIKDAMLSTDEAKKKLRGFAVGTNRVPYDMPAMVHEDERIIPAADNRELMRRLASPSEGGGALATEIRLLRAEVASLKDQVARGADAAESTASSTGQLADQFENATDGGNAFRADVINIVQTKEVA